jgi:hypothetical protein
MKNIQRTCIYHNPYNVINTVIEFVDKTKVGCVDYTRPSLAVDITALKNASIDVKERGVNLRYGTEITCDSMSYCKELINTINVGELRLIDGIKGNFYVTARDRGAGIDFQLLSRLFSKFVTSPRKKPQAAGWDYPYPKVLLKLMTKISWMEKGQLLATLCRMPNLVVNYSEDEEN